MPIRPVPLQSVLGGRVQELREQDGQTQEQLAAALRELGWRATRATVAKIETGRARVGLEELVTLALALHVPLADFVGDEWVSYSAEGSIRADVLRELLRGMSGGDVSPITDLIGPMPDASRAAIAQASDRMAKVAAEAARVWPEPPWRALADAEQDTASDVVRVAARITELSPLQVALLARRIWGRGLSEQRDLLAGPDANATKRGHVTRRLHNELRQAARRGGS